MLWNRILAHEEEIYKEEVAEFQSLCTIYEMEKDLAHKHGKLKQFPKFTHWKPEGSQLSSDLHFSILEGLQPNAVAYQHHVLEAKQHSRSYLYISTQHPSKRPTIVFYSPPSKSSSDTTSSILSFGIIIKIYLHPFAQKVLMWAVVNFYKNPKFVPGCGLWCADDSFATTAPVLLSHLSHPLMTAVDEKFKIWFLDAYC